MKFAANSYALILHTRSEFFAVHEALAQYVTTNERIVDPTLEQQRKLNAAVEMCGQMDKQRCHLEDGVL